MATDIIPQVDSPTKLDATTPPFVPIPDDVYRYDHPEDKFVVVLDGDKAAWAQTQSQCRPTGIN